MFEAMSYQMWVDEQEKKHNTAKKLKKQKCQKCGFCCLRRPCIPTPNELYKIAKFLKMTPKHTITKYFVIDSLASSSTKFIFPAKTTQLDITGKYIPSNRTFDKGYCVFFDKKKGCRIHSVRPQTSKSQQCWNEKATDDTQSTINAWKDFDFSKVGVTEDDLNYDDDGDCLMDVIDNYEE